MESHHNRLSRRVADLFTRLPQVRAVALSGSLAYGQVDSHSYADAASDIDLYVYTLEQIPIDQREKIMQQSGGAARADVGLTIWGPGDEWLDAATGIEVDIIYFDAQWMEEQIKRIMLEYHASLGYSTCLAFTIYHSQVFYDPKDWFARLQGLCQQPYPEPLRENIIKQNHPVLRQIIPSYFFQLEKAVKRGDLVSINHRLAGLLASYFDILFALNRQLHPGEKRLVQKTVAECKLLPENMEMEIGAVFAASASPDASFLRHVSVFLDHLDALLWKEGFRELLNL